MDKIQPVSELGSLMYQGIDPLQHHYWELWFATDPWITEYGYPDPDDNIDDEYDTHDCDFCGGEIADDFCSCTCGE